MSSSISDAALRTERDALRTRNLALLEEIAALKKELLKLRRDRTWHLKRKENEHK